MITLSNGHKFEFAAASGALGYVGEGYWFEKPWHWMGVLDPHAFTIITKTLTALPRTGNLNMWKPWKCVRMICGGFVNSVGLSNKGYRWWINEVAGEVGCKGYKVVVSVMANNPAEACEMALAFNCVKEIVGIEVNLSCPNVTHTENICEIVETFLKYSRQPLMLKLGYDQDYVGICKEFDGKVDAFDLINAVPWRMVFPDDPSPLAKYNLVGGVSGKVIKVYARTALLKVKGVVKTPVLSGGGIDSYEEVLERKRMGADAVSFGTVFITKPWLPNMVVKKYAH